MIGDTAVSTILIVDDDMYNARLLEAMLVARGYATRTAASGPEALAFVAESLPDLILLDIMMPGMDGFEVAQQLKKDDRSAAVPIIMLTALDNREARLKALDMGAEEFLTKPVDRAELWARIKNLLRLKQYRDEAIARAQELEEARRRLEAEIAARKEAEFSLKKINARLEAVEAELEALGHSRRP